MLQKKYGALPTIIIAVQNKVVRAKRLGLFNHYLNHKGTDIPNGRRNSTNKTVLECIVASFNRYYQPETCKRKISHKSLATDDSLEDLRSVAHIAVWKATEKYISGINKKKENKEIHIDYKDRFDFCIFASQQVKFKLRTHLRLLNIDRIYSKLPYSNKARKLYSILPNWKLNLKLENKHLSEKDYQKISSIYKIDKKLVKEVDQFMTSQTISGDESINYKNKNENCKWDILENNGCLTSNENIEDKINNKILNKRVNKIIRYFLNTLSARDQQILNHIKFNELNNINETKDLTVADLAKKYSVSPQRVRQISEEQYKKFKLLVIKNKKHFRYK